MRRAWPVVLCILGAALSGAVLILLVPSLVGSGDDETVWIAVGVSGCLFLAFAAGARYWKRSVPIAGDDK